jgi:hypothetical protein
MASLRNAEEDELGTQYNNKQLADVSADEPIAATSHDEDEEHRRILRAKNAKHAQRRSNAQNQGISTTSLQQLRITSTYTDWHHRRSSPLSSTTPI